MPVPKAQATVTALERLVKVMQEKLPGEIESIQDDGLGLLTPCMSDYFMPGGHITEQILHAPIAVIVTQSAPSATLAFESGDGSEHALICELPVTIRLLFSADVFTPIDRIGREQTRAEYAAHASERYKGAIINTVSIYARDGISIDDIRLTSDLASVGTLESTLKGEAVTQWTITQECLVPSDVRILDSSNAVL